jgi:hypothetical protein
MLSVVKNNIHLWQFWLIFLLFIVFILWILYGGEEDLEYVGLSPLKIGVNAADYINRDKNVVEEVEEIEEEQVTEDVSVDEVDEVDDTQSNITNVRQIIEEEPINYSKFRNTSVSYSMNEAEEIEEEIIEEINIPGTPRTLALGEHKHYNSKNTSIGEKKCKEALEDIFGLPFYCVRPDFLKNPETGRNLELDMFNAQLNLACELNGVQHYQFPNSFHKTREEFLNQVRRDEFKIKMCDENGIYLITVPYTVKHSDIRAYIEDKLPEEYKKKYLNK